MKKSLFLIIAVIFLAGIISSCNKDKDSAEKFSALSVEENKANVESAGIDFIGVMSSMKSIESIGVIINFGDVLSATPTTVKGFGFSKDSKIFATLETFVAAARGEKKLNDVFHAMVSPQELKGDPQSIQEFWDSNVGTYTWNPGLNDFDIVLGGNKIIFKFPATDVSLTNNATLTIYSYTGVNIGNPVDENYTGDLPASLNADLKVGSETLLTYVFGASYNSDGVPNAVASDLTIENYKFEIDITNTTEVVAVDYKFLENGIVVMDLGASGEGLFTEANYNANTTDFSEIYYEGYDWVWNESTQQYEWVWVTYSNEWKETDFEEILHSANAHFQLFNVAIKGDVNVKGLVDQMNIIDDANLDQEATNNSYAAKINEFMNLRLVNVTNNEIMAKAEAYVVHEVAYYGDNYYIDFRLTFGDGSPIDMQTYFNAGFGDFVNELNGFINDINFEYDFTIAPVEY
jgi:hypothetical protein